MNSEMAVNEGFGIAEEVTLRRRRRRRGAGGVTDRRCARKEGTSTRRFHWRSPLSSALLVSGPVLSSTSRAKLLKKKGHRQTYETTTVTRAKRRTNSLVDPLDPGRILDHRRSELFCCNIRQDSFEKKDEEDHCIRMYSPNNVDSYLRFSSMSS